MEKKKSGILILVILQVVFILLAVLFIILVQQPKNNDNADKIEINISQISVIDVKGVEEYYQYESHVTRKLKKALNNSEDYVAVKCAFSAISKEDIVIKRAFADSENFKIVYNDRNYNICEWPINIGDGRCEFFLYILIEKSSIENNLNESAIENHLYSNLEITLR